MVRLAAIHSDQGMGTCMIAVGAAAVDFDEQQSEPDYEARYLDALGLVGTAHEASLKAGLVLASGFRRRQARHAFDPWFLGALLLGLGEVGIYIAGV